MKKLSIPFILLLVLGFSFGASVSLTRLSRIDINPVGAVNSDGQVVYAGVGGALNIYNIYQRDFPQLVGTVEGHSSKIKEIMVEDTRLFVLWEKEGLEIFDITDRYQPVFLGAFSGENDERFVRFTTMDIEGNIIYLGGENFLASVDVSKPLRPVLLNFGGINGAPMKVDFHKNRLLIAAGKLGLGALHVPNPQQFFFIGSQPGTYTTVKAYKDIILYGRLDEPGPNEPSLFGKHLFHFPFKSPTVVKTRDDVIYAGGLVNFAIYRLLEGTINPQMVWNLPNMPTLDCVLRDNLAYLANSYKGLSVFDITDIENPAEIGRLETYDMPRRACIIDDRLFVAAGLSGVIVFDISSPRYPEFITALESKFHTIWDVKKHNGFIYVLGARDDIAENIFVARYDFDGNRIAEYPIMYASKLDPIGELAFSDDFCAIALGCEGIALMKMQGDDMTPAYTLHDGAVQFCDMEIRNEYLFASDYWGAYHIYRIDEGLPHMIGMLKTSENGGNGIALVGKYLLAADGPAGLAIIDISNPKQPEHITSIPTVWGTDIAIEGNYAFLSDGQGACKVFDISRLPNMELVAELPNNGYWMHVYVNNGFIYGIDQFFGVYIYELHTEKETLTKLRPSIPRETEIVEAFPNPFNAETKISFSLGERMDVELSIYDAGGRKVTTLISDVLPVGNYTLCWDASETASGTYFAVLKTPTEHIKQRLMLVK